jgi:hypothetical protein
MTATKLISAAALSTLLAGVSGVKSTSSAVGSVTNGYFGLGKSGPKKGWNLDLTELRGGSTGEFLVLILISTPHSRTTFFTDIIFPHLSIVFHYSSISSCRRSSPKKEE